MQPRLLGNPLKRAPITSQAERDLSREVRKVDGSKRMSGTWLRVVATSVGGNPGEVDIKLRRESAVELGCNSLAHGTDSLSEQSPEGDQCPTATTPESPHWEPPRDCYLTSPRRRRRQEGIPEVTSPRT
jgi:hypothetical protein